MSNFRVHFVANSASKDDLEDLQLLEWAAGTIACTRHSWVWPIYCQVKMQGLATSISYDLEPDAINIIHGQIARHQLKAFDLKKYFIVGIRADYRPFPYGQFEIVQNKHSEGGRRIYMPHLPQPGLVARDSSRDTVVNVCFSGRMQNSGINSDEFRRDLQKIGCQFLYKGEGQWQDMSDVDILIGIRSLSKAPHHSKPPSKLFNAWLAGIPFVGGYDSAYEQVGDPGENYLRVSSYDELIESVKKLKNDDELYEQLVQQGSLLGRRYMPGKTADLWMDFLEKKVFPAYVDWMKGGQCMGAKGWFSAGCFFSELSVRRLFSK